MKCIGIEEKYIREGIRNAKWAGRFQFIRENVLLDCAHNPDGIRVLVDSVKKLSYGRLILIMGMMKDKDAKPMCDSVNEIADVVILTRPDMLKAREPYKLARYFDACTITPNIGTALEEARSIRTGSDLILITGSIFLVGEAIAFFSKYDVQKRPCPESRLRLGVSVGSSLDDFCRGVSKRLH